MVHTIVLYFLPLVGVFFMSVPIYSVEELLVLVGELYQSIESYGELRHIFLSLQRGDITSLQGYLEGSRLFSFSCFPRQSGVSHTSSSCFTRRVTYDDMSFILFRCPYEDLPLHISHFFLGIIARWRLRLGPR